MEQMYPDTHRLRSSATSTDDNRLVVEEPRSRAVDTGVGRGGHRLLSGSDRFGFDKEKKKE